MSRKVALLIGVSEYGEGIPSLSAPRNDVTAMKQVLENPKMGGFDEVTILPDPDLAEMQKAVQQIFASRSKDDLVLLFFSGHGITDDNNKLYFATKGTSKNFYKATSVPASFIQDVSLECYAKRQVMILDCCFSGAFAEGWVPKGLEMELARELGAEGRVVLTSSTAFQKSFQREDGEFSLYTQYILEGIETGAADKNSDGKIYAQELHEYAKAKVKEAKPKQEPGILIDREGFNILISQAPIHDPELSFRKLVEKYTVEDRVTVTGKYILQVKQQDLGIDDERAKEIIDEVLAPYRKRLENIRIYREAFTETVKRHYPLTERFINDLQDLQDILGLEDKDVAEIKEQILAEKESEYQQESATRNLQKNRISDEKSTSNTGPLSFLGQLFAPSSEMSSKQFFDSGFDKRKKGDNQGAIEDYTQAIQINQNWGNPSGTYFGLPSAYTIRGNAYDDLKESQKAIADYNKAIELKSDYALAYYNRGNAYDDLREYQKAIADYSKAIELNSDYATAYNNRGIVYKNLKDYQKAIADYTKAIELKPDYASAYYNRGNAYDDLREYQKAIADYTKSIRLKNIELWVPYNGRGNVYEELKDYQKAIADYNKAITLKSDYANAYYNRAIVYKIQGETETAINDYQKAAELYQKEGKTDDYQDAINQIKKLEK